MLVPILVHRFMLRQLLLPAIGCVAALGLPVMLVALLGHLPGPALGSSLLWSAIYGIAPTALFLTLPIAVGLGATWGYTQLNADGMFTTLQSMRLSVLTLAVPALLLAMPVVVASYTISCWIAPRSVSSIQDVMFTIRNNLSLELFYPQTFYTLADNRYSLYFDRKLDDERIAGVFFHEQRAPGNSQTIIAREAKFETRSGERHIVFLNGTAQTVAGPEQSPRTVVFTELVRPFGNGDSAEIPRRNWRGLFEMDTAEFWRARQTVEGNPPKWRAWISEAVKRFGVPLLGLAHPLAGLALILLWRRPDGRRQRDPILYGLPLAALHLLILFSAEGVVYYGAWLGWLTITMILGELIAAIAAILYRQARIPA